jgi:hypothetical protein
MLAPTATTGNVWPDAGLTRPAIHTLPRLPRTCSAVLSDASVCERQDALTLHRLVACSRTDSLRDWFHAAALRSPDVRMLTG